MLGDDALDLLSHRLQQWMTRAPELEEETALANIALDLLGARRACCWPAPGGPTAADGTRTGWRSGAEEDEFRNVRLVERLDLDFAELVARLLVFSTWRLALFEGLRDVERPCAVGHLRARASKS